MKRVIVPLPIVKENLDVVDQKIRFKRKSRPSMIYKSGIFSARKAGKFWTLLRKTNGSFTIVDNRLKSLDDVRESIKEYDYLSGYPKCSCGGIGCFVCQYNGFKINN